MAAPFHIGRTTLQQIDANGSPADVVKDGDRMSISGTYTPSTAGGPAEGDAFEQQWLGMSEDPDRTIPITGPARFGLDGFWFPEATSVQYVPRQTDESGVRQYSGEFRRLRPSYGVGGEGFAGVVSKRSTAVHSMTADGYLWTPNDLAWSAMDPAANAPSETVETTDGSTAVILGKLVTDATSGPDVLPQLSFGANPPSYYDGACTIERQGDNGQWYPIVGRQIPAVDNPGKIRLGNGLFRVTFAREPVVADSRIVCEAFSQANLEWRHVSDVQIGSFAPTTFPAVVINTPEVATIRVPVRASDNPAGNGQLSMTVQRGQPWVDCDLNSPWLQGLVTTFMPVTETAYTGQGAAINGGIAQFGSVPPAGQAWALLSPFEQVGASDPTNKILAVDKVARPPYFALGATIDNAQTGHLRLVEWVSNYWKIIAAAASPVSL